MTKNFLIPIKFLIMLFLLCCMSDLQGQSLDFSGSEVYGSHCGILGTHPSGRIQVEEWIESEDIDKIKEWLFSLVPARQVYAFEALSRLYELGKFQLSDELSMRLVELRSSTQEVSTCSGCVYSSHSVGTLVKQFDIF